MARGRSKAMAGLSGTVSRLASAASLGVLARPGAAKRRTRLARRKRGGVVRSLGSLASFPQSWGGTKYGRRRKAKR